MKYHEFYSQFANLPLEKRGVMINFIEHGDRTMLDLLREIDANREVLLPLLTREANLLKIAEEGLANLLPKGEKE